MIKDIILPDLGEGIESVEVSEVLVKIGDKLNIDDPIIILESEKASMEIPSNDAGLVKEVLVSTGDEIVPGAILLKVETAEEDAIDGKADKPLTESAKEEVSQQKQEVETKIEAQASPTPPAPSKKSSFASPSVRRFARELGANLSLVSGTGSKSRVTKEDVQSYIKAALAGAGIGQPRIVTMPAIDFSKWGEIESVKLSKIKRITGERLQQAWQTIPHVTQFDEADITDLEAFRKTLMALNENKNRKVTLLPFLMKAVIQLLNEMPEFNTSLDNTGQNLIYKKYFHVGVAIDTPNGLVVPVFRDVDKKSFRELSDELVSTSGKAREKKLMPDEMKGGCFTISSLGGISGTGFTPIVNPPEVAILGVSRSKIAPVFLRGKFTPRTILPFSLSYDHRVIDGAQAARFTKRFGEIVTDFSQLKGLELT
ncbi:MAG: 2-oxo acid dehydrogenase subunit E2 [Candidatus Marinimicrobia bacterium]|nr:2-oxo acid dehydrogenase subunit E2 [Candidatus Neomarinimicrobiota bacterium]